MFDYGTKEVNELKQEIFQLKQELKKSNDNLIVAENKITDLNERLKISFSMDRHIANNELDKFKFDLSELLKLDYIDFTWSKDKELTIDLFDAYRSTLNRIFKVLKRLGIKFE